MKRIFFLFFACLLGSLTTQAQMPDCINSGGYLYLQVGTDIYNYNPNQPPSATNPSLNTINTALPGGAGLGLAVSDYLGLGPTYKTFYTVLGNIYWYYNGTAWVSTGHTAGSVNIAAGGGFIYNLNGTNGQVYKYDGTGPATLLMTVPGFSNNGPFDLIADEFGNWFIMRLVPPQWMRKYDPNGVLLQEYSLVNATTLISGAGGLAVVCDDVYFTTDAGIFKGVLVDTTVVFDPTPYQPGLGLIGDFASCAAGPPTVYSGNDTSFYLYRGCLNGTVPFNIRPYNATIKYRLEFSGTATAGLDYTAIDPIFNHAPMELYKELVIEPLLRSPSAGDKTLVIDVYGEYACDPTGWKKVRTIDVLIKDSLDVSFVTPPITVCPGDDVIITATKDPILDHEWSPSNLLTGNLTSLTVQAKPSVTSRYGITVTYPGAPSTCPPRTLYYTATVEPFPEITVPSDFIICLTDSITFDVSITPPQDYKIEWIPSDGMSTTNSLTSKFFGTAGTYPKTIKVSTLVANCTRDASFSVTVVPPFELDELSKDTTIEYGNSVKLTAKGPNAYIWAWNPTQFIKDYSLETVEVYPKESTTYEVIVFDKYGCRASGYVNVNVVSMPNIFIPNTFSPNGDGLNDIFKIEGMQHEKLVTFLVFDRYGTKVFETTNAMSGWDGTYPNGTPAAADVYFYYIEIANNVNKENVRYKGDILLMR
jgi:gliding motility-associated-like protein